MCIYIYTDTSACTHVHGRITFPKPTVVGELDTNVKVTTW